MPALLPGTGAFWCALQKKRRADGGVQPFRHKGATQLGDLRTPTSWHLPAQWQECFSVLCGRPQTDSLSCTVHLCTYLQCAQCTAQLGQSVFENIHAASTRVPQSAGITVTRPGS